MFGQNNHHGGLSLSLWVGYLKDRNNVVAKLNINFNNLQIIQSHYTNKMVCKNVPTGLIQQISRSDNSFQKVNNITDK